MTEQLYHKPKIKCELYNEMLVGMSEYEREEEYIQEVIAL